MIERSLTSVLSEVPGVSFKKLFAETYYFTYEILKLVKLNNKSTQTDSLRKEVNRIAIVEFSDFWLKIETLIMQSNTSVDTDFVGHFVPKEATQFCDQIRQAIS